MNNSKIKKLIRGVLNKSLAHYGLAITRLETKRGPDLTEVFDNPIQAACYSGTVLPFITVLPLKIGRTRRGINLVEDPRVRKLRDLLDVNDRDAFCLDFNKFFNSYCENKAKNAAERFGLSSDKLKRYPEWASVLPWDSPAPDQILRDYPAQVLRNRAESGMNVKGVSSDQIMKIDHSESHANQFFSLKCSIQKDGYKPNFSFDVPTATLFKVDDDWRWMVGGNGNHRIELLASLGYTETKVRVTALVDRRYAAFWPNVVRGYFTKEEALLIFDSIFEGKGVRSAASAGA